LNQHSEGEHRVDHTQKIAEYRSEISQYYIKRVISLFVSTVLESEEKTSQLTSEEKQVLAMMCHWLEMNESQWKVEQLNEYTTVLRNFLKTNEITLQKMKCPFCSTDLDSGWKCPLNHPILWCSRTFRIITSILLPHTHTATSGLLKCPTCHALSYDLSKENGFQWIKALTNRFQCCSQCDTLLIPFSLSL
jgi:hypothetical protein